MAEKMEFTADMNILPENKSNLYAVGTVTVDHLFVIRDVKAIYLEKEGFDEKQLTVCLPRHYNKKTESWDSIVQLTKDQKKEMEKAVTMDLSNKIRSSIQYPGEYCDIKINLCPTSMAPTLGYAEIHYRDILCLKKVRIARADDGRIQVLCPANRGQDGNYSILYGMVTSEHQKGLEAAIREKFKEVYLKKNGREYQETPDLMQDGRKKEDTATAQDHMQETESMSHHIPGGR